MNRPKPSFVDRYMTIVNAFGRMPSSMRVGRAQNPAEAALRADLTAVAHEIAESELNWGLVGSVSARLGTRRLLFSPAGISFRAVREEDWILVETDEGLASVSTEIVGTEYALHRAIYSAQPEAKGLVHVQPPYATVMSSHGRLELPVSEAMDFWSRVVRVAGDVGTRPQTLAQASQGSRMFLMAGGGVVCWSGSPRGALEDARTIEAVARMLWLDAVVRGVRGPDIGNASDTPM